MRVPARERLSETVLRILKEAIAEAEGREVFAAGRLDAAGLVSAIELVASGTADSVAAPLALAEGADVLIHNHPSGRLEPSPEDVALSAKAGAGGVGSFIVDNGVAELLVVAEPARKRARKGLDAAALAALIDSGGALEGLLPGFDPRPSQIELLGAVCRAFENDGILAAEAGTGVGKSLAYLIPALAWADANDERVVVSTGTINLQQQLVDKDIPLAKKLLGSGAKAMLVKGRGNYLCLSRLSELIDEEGGLFGGMAEELAAVAAWANASPDGSRSDLPFQPSEGLWPRINAEADTCLGLKCRMRDRCFFLAMRKEAAEARLLVANHHLLFADLAARGRGLGLDETAVLPPFKRLVIDEAHAIEQSATSFFSRELLRFPLLRTLGRVARQKKGLSFGLVPALRRALPSSSGVLDGAEEIARAVRIKLEALEAIGRELLADGYSMRLTGALPEDEGLRLRDALGGLANALSDLRKGIREALDFFEDEGGLEEAIEQEARLVIRGLAEYAAFCRDYAAYEDAVGEVHWLKRYKKEGSEPAVEFIITPIDLAPLLAEAVFEPFPTVCCLSATLTAGGSFGFFARRSGLSLARGREPETLRFPSPFPYGRNALLCLVDDGPMPDDEAYGPWSIAAIRALVEVSGGGALVLFTSYEALRAAHAELSPGFEAQGIAALRQGEDDRARLLARFKEERDSVLFATDSFWEGVDAPGDTLRLVVIARLPFRVPTEPVQVARAEAIERAGGRAFMELSLPDAAIRLTQGFGRLIRSSSDRGAVVILDPRMLRKFYGKYLLASLPPARLYQGGIAGAASQVEAFLYQ